MLEPISKQNRTVSFKTHPQSFIIFMLQAMDLVIFSLNEVVGSLFYYSLVTDGINHAAQDIPTRTALIYIYIYIYIYIWAIQLIFSFLPIPNISYDSKRKSVLVAVTFLKLQIKKLQNMLVKEVKVFRSRNSLNDPWNLSAN